MNSASDRQRCKLRPVVSTGSQLVVRFLLVLFIGSSNQYCSRDATWSAQDVEHTSASTSIWPVAFSQLARSDLFLARTAGQNCAVWRVVSRPFIFHDLSWFSSKLHQFHLSVCCYVCSLPSVWTHDDPECLHIILFAWTYMSYIYVLWKIWKLAYMFAFVPPCSICMLEVAFPVVGSIVKGSKAPTLAAALCS